MLLDMQERLNRDPYEAFSVGTISDPGEVRAAFLEITKVYHPARFARMAVEIQRLANEVFLSLRASYDTLSRPSIKPPATNRTTGAVPVLANGRVPATTSTRAPSVSMPALSSSPRPPSQPLPATRPPTGSTPVLSPSAARPSPPSGTRPSSPAATSPAAPTRPTGATPVIQRPVSPVQSQAQTTRMRPLTRPPDAARPPVRMPTSSPPPASISQPSAPRAGAGSSPLATIDSQLAPVVEMLTQGKFADARTALETLVTRHPGVARYKALIHYSRGREAQLARRIDEARVELMDALQLDPDLQVAKSALSELFTRRK